MMFVEEVEQEGRPTDTERYWANSNGITWIKTSLLLLESPPTKELAKYLDDPILAYTETRQYWSYLPYNGLTYHSFSLLETRGGELFMQMEKKDDQLEFMMGIGQASLNFMKEFRAICTLRRLDRCFNQPRCMVAQGLKVRHVLDWIGGPLAKTWRPYSLFSANCQHFTDDLHRFLEHPSEATGGEVVPELTMQRVQHRKTLEDSGCSGSTSSPGRLFNFF